MFEEPAGVNTNQSYITSSGKWYPGLEWIGDVARMTIYMYIRYPNQWTPTNVGSGSTSYSNLGDMPNIFLDWNAADPVSEYEILRNNILEQLQANRNPFIDNSNLATMLWNVPSVPECWSMLSSSLQLEEIDIIIWEEISTDIIHISNSPQIAFRWSIYNISGQKVQDDIEDTEIDISMLRLGIYFLKISAGTKKVTKKIVKI